MTFSHMHEVVLFTQFFWGNRGEEQASLWAGLGDEDTPRAILKGHTATVWSVDASDHLAVSGGMDTSILFWDLGAIICPFFLCCAWQAR